MVLRTTRPRDPSSLIRGLFRGYRHEPDVADDSYVPTYAALRLNIDSWRWAGVPFYVRAGTCLAKSATEEPEQGKEGRTDAYERRLGDAMAGDATLFARQDVVEAAWAIVDPILYEAGPLYDYDPGSWGPAEADQLVEEVGGWNSPT